MWFFFHPELFEGKLQTCCLLSLTMPYSTLRICGKDINCLLPHPAQTLLPPSAMEGPIS